MQETVSSNSNWRKQKMQKRFTLLELLVVIAVIAILAAMLLPALNLVRDVAKKIKCTSNLEQTCIAFTMYSSENLDFIIPTYGFNGNADLCWYQRTMPFLLDNHNIMTCQQGEAYALAVPSGPNFTGTDTTGKICYMQPLNIGGQEAIGFKPHTLGQREGASATVNIMDNQKDFEIVSYQIATVEKWKSMIFRHVQRMNTSLIDSHMELLQQFTTLPA